MYRIPNTINNTPAVNFTYLTGRCPPIKDPMATASTEENTRASEAPKSTDSGLLHPADAASAVSCVLSPSSAKKIKTKVEIISFKFTLFSFWVWLDYIGS